MDALSNPPIICVFAKPSRPGEAKTRLIREHSADRVAQLARAFFTDTWSAVSALPWARAVVATTDPAADDWRRLPAASVWQQGEGDLGRRLERILGRALAESSVAIAIGADTPGLPERLLVSARDALHAADAALGPADDGGFYLVALKRCWPGLFRDLPWSAGTTFAATRERLQAHGMSVRVLEPWFDVDRPADLLRLRGLIERGEVVAATTAELLAAPTRGRDSCA